MPELEDTRVLILAAYDFEDMELLGAHLRRCGQGRRSLRAD